MGAKAGSPGRGLLVLAAVAMALIVVMIAALRPARDGERLERGPAREALAIEPEVDPREMPAPPIPAPPRRAPVELTEVSSPEEVVIKWEPGGMTLEPSIILDEELLNSLIERAGMPELLGDSVLSGVFTGWSESDRGREVKVQLEAGSSRRSFTFTVDEPFRVEQLAAGRYRLVANMVEEPFWCGELSDIELPTSVEVGGLVIVLGPAVELSGTVRGEQGEALLGAKVRMARSGGSDGAVIHADAAGAYRLVGDVAGSYEAAASYPGYLDAEVGPMELRTGEARRHDFVLERGLILAGRVVDASGEPLEGIDVFLRSRSQAMNGETAGDGRFVFTPVRADEIRIYARSGGPNGQANSACCLVQVTRGLDLPKIELTLRPSCEIHGVLVDADGVPIAGVEVVARAVDNEHVKRAGSSAQDGAFRIQGLYEGTYELLVAGNLRTAPRASVAAGLGAPSVVVEFAPLPQHPFAPE